MGSCSDEGGDDGGGGGGGGCGGEIESLKKAFLLLFSSGRI